MKLPNVVDCGPQYMCLSDVEVLANSREGPIGEPELISSVNDHPLP